LKIFECVISVSQEMVRIMIHKGRSSPWVHLISLLVTNGGPICIVVDIDIDILTTSRVVTVLQTLTV
jgi:hypothetical protein